MEHSPVRSSGSNGIIERGIKDVEYQIRCMKSALDDRICTDLSIDSNVLPWLIGLASVLVIFGLEGWRNSIRTLEGETLSNARPRICRGRTL